MQKNKSILALPDVIHVNKRNAASSRLCNPAIEDEQRCGLLMTEQHSDNL